MKQLLNSKRMIIIILLVITVSSIGSSLGSRFFHAEMTRQINGTLKSQAIQIVQGYETFEQDQGILSSGIQADALELNRIHGEFLMTALAQSYQDSRDNKLTKQQLENRIVSIVENSENNINLKGNLIWNASTHRNELDQMIKETVQELNQSVSYLGTSPSEVFHKGNLDIVIRGGAEQPWETYARAVYYQPLDLIVVFEGTSSYAEDNVERLFWRNQENLERNIMMIGSMEDVIIFQKNGYSLYSGRFEKDVSRRSTRIAYIDTEDPDGLGSQIAGSDGTFKTMQVTTPDRQVQERYGYVLYDAHQDQYVIVSRSTEEIDGREKAMKAISTFVGAVNVIVVSLIAYMLFSRDKTLKEEGLNP